MKGNKTAFETTKIRKNDIRRYIPGMLVNAINSGDFNLIQSFLFEYFPITGIFIAQSDLTSKFQIPPIITLVGPQLLTHYFLGLHIMFPDIVMHLHNSRIITYTSVEGSQIVMGVEFVMTKMAHLPIEVWIPPLEHTPQLYEARSMTSMLAAVHKRPSITHVLCTTTSPPNPIFMPTPSPPPTSIATSTLPTCMPTPCLYGVSIDTECAQEAIPTLQGISADTECTHDLALEGTHHCHTDEMDLGMLESFYADLSQRHSSAECEDPPSYADTWIAWYEQRAKTGEIDSTIHESTLSSQYTNSNQPSLSKQQQQQQRPSYEPLHHPTQQPTPTPTSTNHHELQSTPIPTPTSTPLYNYHHAPCLPSPLPLHLHGKYVLHLNASNHIVQLSFTATTPTATTTTNNNSHTTHST